jgi:hypothetical protein
LVEMKEEKEQMEVGNLIKEKIENGEFKVFGG